MEFKIWMIAAFYILCFQGAGSQTAEIKCPSNFYGNQNIGGCIPCGKCLNSKCGAQQGTCVGGCAEGYEGTKCDKRCKTGRYGKNCAQQCNTTCINTKCNPITGFCNGCLLGYTGKFCEEMCASGSYGWNCENKCTSCLNNECNPQTGHCMSCPSGFIGEKCSLDCPYGTYGVNCSNTCYHCSRQQCNKTTGVCINGCRFGYHGDNCESEYLSFRNGLLYGSLSVAALLFLVGFVIFICLQRRRQRRNSEQSILKLQRIQRRLDGYTSYPLHFKKGDQSDDKSDDLSSPESPSPPETRKFGSFLLKREPKEDVRLEPEGSPLPDDDVTDERKSGYLVVVKPDLTSDDGYLLVDRKDFHEDDYENVSHLKVKDPEIVCEEIYENSEALNTVIVPRKSRLDSQPVYENFDPRK